MSESKPAKVLIPRPVKATATDSDESSTLVATGELELVSTQALEVMLESDGSKSRKSIEEAMADMGEGVLARDKVTGNFEIIDDDDLREILKSQTNGKGKIKRLVAEPSSDDEKRPAAKPQTTDEPDIEELSLVSTQRLRKLFGEVPEEDDTSEESPNRSYNPYDNATKFEPPSD